MSLTVCCLAGEPPAQVAQVLECFRAVADDVFVAVDSRIDPATLAPYDGVADRVVRYEFGRHPDQARPWMLAQCHGDWILSIDADEVPSAALVDALPELLEDPEVMQYGLPRRWLFPHSRTFLAELPWWPDFQVRLVRNGPLVHHPGRVHEPLRQVFPSRNLDLPLYHLALLTTDEQSRRDRGRRYEQHTPGLVAYGGGLLNETMYLPELTATSAPAEVPPADRTFIEGVLAARAAPVTRQDRRASLPLPLATRAEIDRHVPATQMADDDYAASITAYAERGLIAPGEIRPVHVTVENRGGVAWRSGVDADPLVTVAYRWRTDDGTALADDGRHTPLPSTVAPGASTIVPLGVAAPKRPGRYTLAIDLVHENVRWFGTSTMIDMIVGVLPARPAAPGGPMLITTIVARNYLPRARLLARSFLRHHPGGRVAVLVIDADGTERADEPFEVLTLANLPERHAELHRMAFIYDVTELATALKPMLLRHLLFDRAEPAVTYLDPDIEVFAPLDDLDSLARLHGIVLTPHRLDPFPDDGYFPESRTLLLSGAFNLGFIAVGHAGRTFLERWSAHCKRDCIVAVDDGLFVDQRWVDVGVVPFPHHIVDDPGCNVAYWNLDSRPITIDGDGYRAGGWPLRFFHYSGYDTDRPYLLSKYQGDRPRNLLSARPELAELVAGYAARLAAEGDATSVLENYGWDLTPGGTRLDMTMRRLVRDEILRRERGVKGSLAAVDDLPDFLEEPDDRALLAFLASPLPDSPVPKVGRYLHLIYLQRPDVQQAYPDLHSKEGLEAFHVWVRASGRHEHSIPDPLVPPAAAQARRRTPPPLRTGVNIVGYFRAELGVGEAARAMLATLERLGEPCAVVNETNTSNRQQHRFERSLDEPTNYDVNLVCVNSDQTPQVLQDLDDRLRPDQHTIGLWAWELEEFPPAMQDGLRFVDEVWTYSRHAAAAIRRVAHVPVHVVPPPVLHYALPAGHRRPLGIDAAFTFLFCFDANSCVERKNPEAVVRAFCSAFDPGEGPTLIVKSHNARFDASAMERLRLLAAGRPDIHVVDTVLDITEMRSLIAGSDCYVSLHRAEGFGYTMAEAMLAGVPVIATNYSGNLEFMDDRNSFLVRAGRSSVSDDWGPYPAGATWAEPDIEHAAALMRLVYEDPHRCAEVARRGQHDIETHHTPVARAPLVAARLAASRARSRTVVAPARRSVANAAGRISWRAVRRAGRLLQVT